MATDYQVLQTIQRQRPLTGELETFTVIVVDEVTKVRKREIQARHVYWVPEKMTLTEEANYLEPIDEPDYNLKNDFKIYRQKFDVLTPAEIKQIRENYQLSLRQYALVLGMSYSTLSEIENGLVLQSDEQESLFQLSKNHLAFRQLVQTKRHVLPVSQFQKIQQKVAVSIA